MAESTPPGAPTPVRLQISSDSQSDATVLTLAGELDIASAPSFERALDGLPPAGVQRRLVIDLSGLAFMDSTGLRALLLARQRAEANDTELLLRPGPRQVQRVFELSGTLDTFAFES
jgi:anti-sigma B factor antagonist